MFSLKIKTSFLLCFFLYVNYIQAQTKVKLTGSGNQCRLSWNIIGDTPNRFIIERRVNGGNWAVICENYSMPYPFKNYKFSGINKNFYFVDNNLKNGESYEYKVNSIISNRVKLIGSTYYVDATNGNNANSGLTPNSAWSSIKKANGARFPGDLVLFKRGESFYGSQVTFYKKGSGTENNPIKWDAYGNGEKPILNINDKYGLNFFDVSNWVVENLQIQGGREFIIRINAIKQNVQNIKLFNLYLDGSTLSGFSSIIMMYEQNASQRKTSIRFIDDIEIAFNQFVNAPLGSSAVKVFACRSGVHQHNNYYLNNGGASSIAGGSNHVFEFNEIKAGDYGKGSGSEPEGTKAHGQQHPLVNLIYRHNIIYNCYGYGLSIQDSKNGLVEFNTVYNGKYGYGAFFMQAKNEPQDVMGNVVRNNIFYGSRGGEGAVRNVIARVNDNGQTAYNMGLDWRDKVDWNNNCIFQGSGHIVKFYDTINGNTSISNSSDWINKWLPYHPNDINVNPLFVDPLNGNFTLQPGSPAEGMGYASEDK